jgi:hypothetical protein
LSREVFEQDGVSRAELPSGPIAITTSIWPPERKMAYWRRGALRQSLKRPLGERVKVILLAAGVVGERDHAAGRVIGRHQVLGTE